MRRRFFNAAVLSGLFGRWGIVRAAEPTRQPTGGLPNLVTPTWGGKQFWQDELFFHQWHIQRNVITGHHRLLDGDNRRHAWGSFDDCRGRLDQIKSEQKLPPMSGPGVVVLHGLMRSGASMDKLAGHLREQGRFAVFNVTYPTTRGSVGQHAEGLARVIEGLEGIERLHFVGHSLGNLVIRHWLGDQDHPPDGHKRDGRVARVVMLGPPNHGAALAETFGRNVLFDLVAGESGSQIARQWQDLAARLATPKNEFGIIAGGRGNKIGYNPILGEDNDLLVTVESTQLAGAADFAVLPVLHTVMMDDRTVQEYTLRFVQHGYFVSADKRQPIPPEAS